MLIDAWRRHYNTVRWLPTTGNRNGFTAISGLRFLSKEMVTELRRRQRGQGHGSPVIPAHRAGVNGTKIWRKALQECQMLRSRLIGYALSTFGKSLD